MKDRIMNVLMLITVGAALILSLNGAPSAQDRPALSQVFISSSDVPLPTPRPIDSFRAQREEDRRQSIQALTRIQENPEMAAALRSIGAERLAGGITGLHSVYVLEQQRGGVRFVPAWQVSLQEGQVVLGGITKAELAVE